MIKKDFNLFMVDDHELIVLGIKHILKKNIPEVKEIDSALSLKEAKHFIKSKNYDLYILDLELPDADGFNVIEEIRKVNPQAHIIMNTMHDELWSYKKFMQFDVDGIVYKSIDSTELVEAVRTVLNGEKFYCSKVKKLLKIKDNPLKEHTLSKQEMKVLKFIAEGKSTSEIAEELCISVNTVETHRRHLNEKLNAKNVANLIMIAISKGLLTCK